jgi:dipeptidyl aminopeptidase/acylaminoacyl peptidase
MDDTNFLQQLLSLPTVLYARLSPDGRWVAFMWYRVHSHIDVFVVPADGSAAPLALTNTPEETQLVSWTPDSQAVIVAEDHDGDERASLYRVELAAPGVMIPLTENQPPYFLRGGAVAPDGALYYAMNYDAGEGTPLEAFWVYRHDLASGERLPIARPNKASYGEPLLNTSATHLLYMRKDRHPSGQQYHLVDVAGNTDREILNFGDAIKVDARWLADGKHVIFLTDSVDGKPQNHRSLGLYSIEDEEIRWLLDDPQRTVEGVRSTSDGLVIVDEVRNGRRVPGLIDPQTRQSLPFPSIAGNLQLLGKAADGAWVGIHYDSTTPPDLVKIQHAEPAAPAHAPGSYLQSLTRFRERIKLDLAKLVGAEEFHWRSTDGLGISGWLYRATPNPRRAILYIHGGPTAHSEERLSPQIQYFVAQGFNVLDINYRGSTGYGLQFREAIKEDGWGGREQADIASGAQALIEAGLAEMGRVGVTGTSYGGYSAWCQITHTSPEVIAAAAPICGMTDLIVDYATTRPDLRPYSEEMIGGTPEEIPAKYRERSPINYVEQIRGRLLIVQGAMDPNVTPENVRLVVERLAAANIPYELLEFSDEGHGISKPANQIILYQRLVAFFDASL